MSSEKPLAHDQSDLRRIYARRFESTVIFRQKLWKVLVDDFFSRFIPPESDILDLGCGYGEFINAVKCRKRRAMDLNQDSRRSLNDTIDFIEQDCSTRWPLKNDTLDVVFSSNFFEHLPDKASLGRTFDEVWRCLKPGGHLIAMGPNVKAAPGAYWDFWDHYLPLTELSLKEALETRGFSVGTCLAKFLPFTMSGKTPPPIFLVKAYLKLPVFWRFFGGQFLVVATKPHIHTT